ncbi:MAG: hypothetical protein ACLFMO_01900 [Eubacteriales bacterium]
MNTFQDYYQANISPKLKEIDLFFKTKEQPEKDIPFNVVSELLDIKEGEVRKISSKYNLDYINKANFFIIMREGSSEICKLFNRQLSCGLSSSFTPKDISYIYQIPIDIIKKAMIESEIHNITPKNLDTLFSYIYINF